MLIHLKGKIPHSLLIDTNGKLSSCKFFFYFIFFLFLLRISCGCYVHDSNRWCIISCRFRSVGCTVIEMLTGDPPLKHLLPLTAMLQITNQDLRDKVTLPEGVSQDARDFVGSTLTRWVMNTEVDLSCLFVCFFSCFRVKNVTTVYIHVSQLIRHVQKISF